MAAPPSFGTRLREAREGAGLTQAALGRKAGMTAPYLSLLEGGQRRPPSPPHVERLAQALGQEPGPWLELAALERAPAPLRKRVEGLERERGALHRSRDRILTTTLFRVVHSPGLLESVRDPSEGDAPFLGLLKRLAGRLAGVGSAREALRRSDEILEKVSPSEKERLIEALPEVLAQGPAPATPAAGPTHAPLDLRGTLAAGSPALDTLSVDARWASPGAFLWRLPDDQAWPRLEAGDLLLVHPGREPGVGDLLALRFQGRDLVRRLEGGGPDPEPWRLGSLRPEQPPLRLPPATAGLCGVVGQVIRVLA